MKKKSLLLLLFLIPALAAAVPSPEFKSNVNARVAAARKIAPDLGVHIQEVESGETVYSFNAKTRRILASNTKLVTTAAALDRLGPGYFFETEILVRGTVSGDELVGDLAVRGGGDPHLSGRAYFGDPYGPVREWATVFKAHGIRRIRGKIFLDHGLFDDERVHPDWPTDQLRRWYEAPVDALSFTDNCVLVRVRPNGPAGRPARVEVVPELDMFTVESTATTSRGRQGLVISRKLGAKSHVLTVTGKISTRTDSVDKWITITDPPSYFGAALVAGLAEEGIDHEGELLAVSRLERSGDGWRPLLTHRTDLLTVLEVINKRSQNFYAESTLKLLGAELCGEGTWKSGLRAAAEFLSEVGLRPGTYRMADGSGMSRNNLFSPLQVTQLLRFMFSHPLKNEYIATLPFSGEEDLSWKKRLAEPPYRKNVWAKTGTLRGVSTLSGYARARSGKLYVFSILMNGSRSAEQSKAAQDRIVRAVIDHG